MNKVKKIVRNIFLEKTKFFFKCGSLFFIGLLVFGVIFFSFVWMGNLYHGASILETYSNMFEMSSVKEILSFFWTSFPLMDLCNSFFESSDNSFFNLIGINVHRTVQLALEEKMLGQWISGLLKVLILNLFCILF